MNKPRILIISDFYLPGFKSGGGMRTVANTVKSLSDDFEFRLLTRDHDGFGDKTPYDGIQYGGWNEHGPAKVRYLRPSEIKPWVIADIVRECRPDAVYMNSVFSTLSVFFFLARKLGIVTNVPVGIAACGELTDGALSQRRIKKVAFLWLSKILGLHEKVFWRATDTTERDEISEQFNTRNCFIAPDITTSISSSPLERIKVPGLLNLLFFSRIVPMKNLDFLFSVLKSVDGVVNLKIIGPAEDKEYLAHLMAIAKDLPSDKSVEFIGPKSQDEISHHLSVADFFVLPSLGENFGHAIVESLSAGCPVVISDRTPWKGLEALFAGFDIPIESKDLWIRTLNRMVLMGVDEHRAFQAGAASLGNGILADSDSKKLSLEYFRSLVSFHGEGS